MSPTIRVDEEVFAALQERAQAFVDTPNDVLRSVLGLGPKRKEVPDGVTIDRRTVQKIIQQSISEYSDFEILQANATFIHFAPRSWVFLRERQRTEFSDGWIFAFGFESRADGLGLFLQIGPGHPDIRRRIYESVRGASWFTGRKALSPRWCRVFRMSFLSKEDLLEHGQDMEWIERRIREEMKVFVEEKFPVIDDVVRKIAL